MICLIAVVLAGIRTGGITLTLPSTPVPQALSLLSKASGRNLAATSVFSNDVILARLKDAPVETTLARLAQSMYGKWKAQPDGSLLLVQDIAAIRRQEQTEASEGVKALASSFQYLNKRLAQQPIELDAKEVQANKARERTEETRRKAAEAAHDYATAFVASTAAEESPGWRALARLIPLIGSGALLDMPHDDSEVWAESPTPMQHEFPAGSQEILAQYRRELALVDPTLDARRVEVVIQRWEMGTAFNANIAGLDTSGKAVDKAFVRLNNDSDLLKIPLPDRNRFVPKPDEKPLTIPQEAVEARIALSRSSKDPARYAILEAWKPRLEDPVHFEPTKWHFGADLVAAAEATDRNMIGSINDMISANYWTQTKITATQLLHDHAADITITPDNWMVVRSHEPRTRCSRSEAREWIRKSVAQGGVSVDDAASWAAKSTDRFPFTDWTGEYMHVLFPGQGPYSALATTLDEFGLRLWDSLGAGTRDSLKLGATVRLSDLTPEAKAHVSHLVYWYNGLDDVTIDPTDRLPTGIAGGTVSMTISEKTVIEGWSSVKGPPATRMPIDATMLGWSLVRGSTYWSIPPEVFRAWDRFRLGVHRSYDLHFVLQPGNVPMTESLTETLFDPSSQILDQLPDGVRSEVEKSRQAELSKPAPVKNKDVPPPY